MCDLMVLAFQGDVTRISTFMFANEGSNRSYPFIDVPEGHHDLSHHGGDAKKHEKIKKINRFHVEPVRLLPGQAEGDPGGRRHAARQLDDRLRQRDQRRQPPQPRRPADPPGGQGGGSLQTGRHLKVADNTPLNNLYLSLLDRMGAPVDRLGDSTGRLEGL